ncbi:MAG TPA: sigma-54 dependent transcriptional regulator [Acidobacteriota bacterium]|nr:sigma-54 dependent transcriptional regulator [Acidobacteriota bacterium]
MEENNAQILIVDDEEYICEILSRLMEKGGFRALVAHDGETALKMIRSEMPEVLLSDIKMPGIDGMEVLKRAKELDPDLPVIMITAHADIHGAVEALRSGAHDYLAKPFEHHEVVRIVHRAMAERELKRKIRNLSSQLEQSVSLSKIMGPSDAVGKLISDVNRVAKSDFTVVILGETGSGKELVARAIHLASNRSSGPFLAIDCGAIPETLLESELFGHEKGAFTGAMSQKKGKLEVAKGGTLLLDEISNMPLGSQAKLLRVLQEKKVYRVGGTNALSIDVRLLVASNQDLGAAVVSNSFRRDLFYRLNEFTIKIPPLRERKEDIPYLAKRFLETTSVELSKNVKGFSESAVKALLDYDWPGNVRQLRSTIRRAVLLANDRITEKHLDMKRAPAPGLASIGEIQGMPWEGLSLKEIVGRHTVTVEREVLIQVLKHTGGNKAKAARILQIDYKTIHTKLKQSGLSVQKEES